MSASELGTAPSLIVTVDAPAALTAAVGQLVRGTQIIGTLAVLGTDNRISELIEHRRETLADHGASQWDDSLRNRIAPWVILAGTEDDAEILDVDLARKLSPYGIFLLLFSFDGSPGRWETVHAFSSRSGLVLCDSDSEVDDAWQELASVRDNQVRSLRLSDGLDNNDAFDMIRVKEQVAFRTAATELWLGRSRLDEFDIGSVDAWRDSFAANQLSIDFMFERRSRWYGELLDVHERALDAHRAGDPRDFADVDEYLPELVEHLDDFWTTSTMLPTLRSEWATWHLGNDPDSGLPMVCYCSQRKAQWDSTVDTALRSVFKTPNADP